MIKYIIVSYDPKGKKDTQYWNGKRWSKSRLDIAYYPVVEANKIWRWIIENIDMSYRSEEIEVFLAKDYFRN